MAANYERAIGSRIRQASALTTEYEILKVWASGVEVTRAGDGGV